MQYRVEEVFRTEGVPEFTFVKPPNYNEILVDIRNEGKPTIVEGNQGPGRLPLRRRSLSMHFLKESSNTYPLAQQVICRKSSQLLMVNYRGVGLSTISTALNPPFKNALLT